MSRKLIIDGNAVYELDEDCMLTRRMKEEEERIKAEQKKAGRSPETRKDME